MNLRSIRKLFARSPDTHRSVFFWHWPAALPPKTVEREIDEILANGIGGVLIDSPPSSHADDYLDDDWLTALAAAASRARKRRDSVWIYDDLASPNSPAKEQRRRKYPDHASSYLQYEQEVAGDDTLLRFHDDPPYAVFVNEGGGYRQIDQEEWETLSGNEEMLHCFHHRRSEIHMRYLHAESVRDYLDQTYDPIRDKTKRFFGNTLGVILANNAELHSSTDLVSLETWTGETLATFPQTITLPWDEDLPDIFERAYGYPLIPELPKLISDKTTSPTLTFHFWSLIADLFREGFSHTLQTWGEENKIPACGFFPMRGDSAESVYETGPRMPLYALQTYPTIRLSDVRGAVDLVEQKQAVSTQRQLETRGLIGVYENDPQITIDDRRETACRDIALGITYRTFDGTHRHTGNHHPFTPHLTPGDTAWNWMNTHHDRLARLTWIQSLGGARCEILLLLPESSMQATNQGDRRRKVFHSHLRSIAEGLLVRQIDFDFGNERLIGLHAQAEHNRIVIKNTSYSVVVMPPMINVQSRTFALLQDFTMSGGRLLCIGTVPYLLDGEPTAKLDDFFEHYAHQITNGIDLYDYGAVFDALTEWNARTVRISNHTGGEILATRRELEDLHFIHVTKTGGRSGELRIEFDVEMEGRVEFWNHIDGTMTPVCACTAEEPVVIAGEWGGGDARTYVVIPEPLPEDFVAESPTVVERTIEPAWTATREHGTPRMLETCRFAGHPWGDLFNARENLRERLGANPAGVIGHFQWLLNDDVLDPDLDHELVLIAPEKAVVTLNRVALDTLSDPSINLPGFTGYTLPAQAGTLQIVGKFLHPDLLAAPIVIPRARRNPDTGEIDAIPVELKPWSEQGLDFFAHTVTYSAEIQGYERFDDAPIWLECEDLHSPAEIRVNGKVIAHRVWETDQIDLRPHWTSGPLTIEIEVAGTWANIFQPESTLPVQGLDTPPRIVIHAHTADG